MQRDEGFESRQLSGSGLFWNILTVIVLLGILVIVGVFFLIYTNPYIALNPFPPPRVQLAQVQPTKVSTADTATSTATSTKIVFPSTWTPTFTLAPTDTSTPLPPTATPTITQPVFSTYTVTVTPASHADMPFSILGLPEAISSTIFHPGPDCKWMGVGGQALDMQNASIVQLTVQLGGILGGSPVYISSLTGTALQYGPAGYEFTLSDHPVASVKSLWVQLFDQAGLPLSDQIYFDTFNDCSQNLVLITFKQVR